MSEYLNIGIDRLELEGIILIIKKNQKFDDAVLFGSRAKGTFSNGSDIDIALKGKCIVLNDILDLFNELDALNLPYKFDLVIFDRIKEKALIEHIDRIGISLLKGL